MSESVVGTSADSRIRRQCGGTRDARRASSSSSDPIRREPRHGTTGGRVSGYRVGSDGSLVEITSAPAAVGITGAAAA